MTSVVPATKHNHENISVQKKMICSFAAKLSNSLKEDTRWPT